MKIKTVNNYYTDENTYIVYDENTKNGLVIDPGYKCDGILKAAQDDGVNIKYVLITHCHYDHISDMEQLREKTGAKLVSGDKASINITDPDINLSYSGSVGRSDLPTGDGDILVKSIKTRIYTLDDDTEVFPGHGGQSSVGYEKKYNMYIKD